MFGVKPDGTLTGQQVSDKTLRDVAQAVSRFEPPADLPLTRVEVSPGREALIVAVTGNTDAVPFTYEGRAYERVASTTRVMPQKRYEELLIERAHSKRRWENQPAEDATLRDIDRELALEIVDAARAAGRLVGPVGRSAARILDHFGIRTGGNLLRAAIVLFGKRFMPDFPQCELRMARFRGTDKAEFLDQRNTRGAAFRLLSEAQVFCQRHLPLPAR